MTRAEMTQRLLLAWSVFPSLRYGQFLENGVELMRQKKDLPVGDMFFVTDLELVQACEAYAKEYGGK